jgi:hypothetical protein
MPLLYLPATTPTPTLLYWKDAALWSLLINNLKRVDNDLRTGSDQGSRTMNHAQFGDRAHRACAQALLYPTSSTSEPSKDLSSPHSGATRVPAPRHYLRRFPLYDTPGSLCWIEPLLITSRHPSSPLPCDLAS